ncbi:MAG: hypothetical protein U0U67_12055 [Chitinophagales bacterium]
MKNIQEEIKNKTMKYEQLIQKDKTVYLEKLEEVNWFKYADREEIISAINETENNLMLVYVLEEFVFNEDNFDHAKSYEQFLYTFLKEFQIDYKTINASQDDNLITIAIETKKNNFEYIVDLDQTEEYFDFDLIEYFFNKEFLVKENIIERFYFLPDIDENISLYFTHPTIQHRAAKEGLIPTNKEFFALLDNVKDDEEDAED